MNKTSLSREYALKWQESIDNAESRYVPEKYQLGIVTEFLDANQIRYATEAEVFCYPIDILGYSGDSTIAIELKSGNMRKGIEQALRNSDYVDFSYLSVWEDDVSDGLLNRVEDLPIGLIGVGDSVQVCSWPNVSDKQLCSSSNIIDTVEDNVRGDPPLQQ